MKNLFLLGAGFTKAALPNAPLNSELLKTVIEHVGQGSCLAKYKAKYEIEDVEVLLTRLDLKGSTDDQIHKDRQTINQELASYFRTLRFTKAALDERPWLSCFATTTLGENDTVVSLNYDCFLEGLLDECGVWSPNTGYAGVSNALIDSSLANPKNIIFYKIHGSEHFGISPLFNKPEQHAILMEFSESLFPKSATHSHFGSGVRSKSYIIAPSFVKIPHLQIADMMLKVLDVSRQVENFIIIGCGLRLEDNFLWLMLTSFLNRLDKNKRLVIVDPAAAQIASRITSYWIGDIRNAATLCLLPCGLASSVETLNSTISGRHPA